MTKMAAMPVYGKHLKKSSPYILKLHKLYINDDPMSTLTHLKTMSDLAKLDFVLIVCQGIR